MKNKQEIYKITSIVLIIDQIIKLLVQNSIKLNTKIKIIPNFFSLFYVQNKGAAFSILEDSTIIIILISVAFILLLNYYIKKEPNLTKLSRFALGILLGGIFGNLMDRIIHHAVIDYLAFYFFSYSFPIFNVADIAIVMGVILLIIDMIIEKKRD